MQHDGPASPNLGRFGPGATNEQNPAAEPDAADGAPNWPGAGDRLRRVVESAHPPRGYVSVVAFGISLGANVAAAVSLFVLLLFGHGILVSGGGPGQSSKSVSTSGLARSSPTPTPSAVPSSTPRSGWLQVAPDSVQLGCQDGQRNQFVVLRNNGPVSIGWQVVYSGSGDQAGVAVAPQQGNLAAGADVPLQLQNMTHANGSQGSSGQQGVIEFAATTSDAGSPASLTYATVGCN